MEFASLGVNWGWFCKLTKKGSRDAVGYETYTLKNCETLNHNRNCYYYKRKWYLFWIKEDA